MAQFWDGREPDVEAQAGGPVLNPIEMAMPSKEAVVTTLKSMDAYVEAFGKAFPGEEDAVTYSNMQAAIGAFERNLVTPGPFDAYLAGDVSALTDAQKAGLDRFVETGCTTCHMGPGVGGSMYQKLGLVKTRTRRKMLVVLRLQATKRKSTSLRFLVFGMSQRQRRTFMTEASLRSMKRSS